MKVAALNYFNPAGNNCSKNKPHFDGSYEVIVSKLKSPVTNYKQAQDVFGKLICEMGQDNTIRKTNFFDTIQTLFDEKGLKGLFSSLKNIGKKDNTYTGCMMHYVRENGILNLAKDEKGSLSLVNLSGNPQDIRFGFSAGPTVGGFEFYTDRQGDLFVEQIRPGNILSTGFYSDTGTKKIVLKTNGFETERTYYNKDGSKPFFKNLFLGGVTVKGFY